MSSTKHLLFLKIYDILKMRMTISTITFEEARKLLEENSVTL